MEVPLLAHRECDCVLRPHERERQVKKLGNDADKARATRKLRKMRNILLALSLLFAGELSSCFRTPFIFM